MSLPADTVALRRRFAPGHVRGQPISPRGHTMDTRPKTSRCNSPRRPPGRVGSREFSPRSVSRAISAGTSAPVPAQSPRTRRSATSTSRKSGRCREVRRPWRSTNRAEYPRGARRHGRRWLFAMKIRRSTGARALGHKYARCSAFIGGYCARPWLHLGAPEHRRAAARSGSSAPKSRAQVACRARQGRDIGVRAHRARVGSDPRA